MTKARVRSEPLTYRRDGRHSWFRDRILTSVGRDAGTGATERLQRHALEMTIVLGERHSAAARALRAGGFEFRVEPNTTPGTGGDFAPPLWTIELFATAPRPHRVLADLIPARFPMPPGVSSINLPIIQNGSVVQPSPPATATPDTDITDQAGSSSVVTLTGQVDCALQLLEQSPAGAHVDWAFMTDLAAAYDADLEAQLLSGAGTASDQILGTATTAGAYVTYNNGSPTGSGMYPFLGQAGAQIGDNRDLPPECWLMRTARWMWITTSEDTQGLPFGLPSPFFMGNTSDTPDPVGGLLGLPVFLDDAIPNTVTWGTPSAGTPPVFTGGTQDLILGLRPSDLILFEGNPHISVGNVYRQPLSGALGVRIQLHDYAAAITNRYTTGIAAIGGTGFAVQSGF